MKKLSFDQKQALVRHLQSFVCAVNLPLMFFSLTEKKEALLGNKNFEQILDISDGKNSIRSAVEQLVSGHLSPKEYLLQIISLNTFLLGRSNEFIVVRPNKIKISMRKISHFYLKMKYYVNKYINEQEFGTIEEVLFEPYELEFIGGCIEKFFQKYFPVFSERVSKKVNQLCEPVGTGFNLFTGTLLIISMSYLVARMMIILFTPSFVLLWALLLFCRL
ncbi:MAG: hypothetical protein V4439_01650 [Patescibacteria group bacterium]